MASLYRKWRPQRFSEVAGQDHIKKTLIQAFKTGRMTHAYLFAGPRGTGKTTTARILAKAFNCEGRMGKKRLGFEDDKSMQNKKWSGEPCNKCDSCQEITRGESMDVIEIDAASNRGIDEIRELREKIKFTPVKSHYKIFIIDEVHMLTKEAFNALLKTLEEPPAHAVFILATTEAHKLPATILSRCQRYDFKRAYIKDIGDRLNVVAKGEELKIQPEVTELLGRLADGSFRDGLSLLDQLMSASGQGEIDIGIARSLLGIGGIERVEEFFSQSGKIDEWLRLVNDLYSEGIDMGNFVNNLIEGGRKLLVINSGGTQLLAGEMAPDELERWLDLAGQYSAEEILDLISRLHEVTKEIKMTPMMQLPLEVALIEWWHRWRKDKISQEQEKESRVSVVEKVEKEEAQPIIVQDILKSDEIGDGEPAIQVDALTSGEESREREVSLDKKCWERILEKMKPYNHSLHMLLRDAVPESFSPDKIILKVKFRFHAQRLHDIKNRVMIEKVCEEVVGRPIRLECHIDNSLPKPEPMTENELLEAAIEQFGAE